MSWVAVAVAAGAAISGAASYAGSKKQGDAARRGSDLQMEMFNRVNQQQQPFIQGGYGAMGRLNTLLGLGGGASRGGAPVPAGPAPSYMPTAGGGVQRIAADGPAPGPGPMGGGNARLRQLLALRAAHGDSEAARILGGL